MAGEKGLIWFDRTEVCMPRLPSSGLMCPTVQRNSTKTIQNVPKPGTSTSLFWSAPGAQTALNPQAVRPTRRTVYGLRGALRHSHTQKPCTPRNSAGPQSRKVLALKGTQTLKQRLEESTCQHSARHSSFVLMLGWC